MKEKAPSKRELEKYLAEGKTHQQMVDAHEESTGIRVARTTISMALKRHGLISVNPRPRYADLLPWRVAKQHQMDWDARMLRLEGRSRAGEPLDETKAHTLLGWLNDLDEKGLVVTYDRELGFRHVPRMPEDRDIVRLP